MIYKNGKEITAVSLGTRAIAAIYKGTQLVWQAIRSCFGSGQWINEKPWINEEAWKNN